MDRTSTRRSRWTARAIVIGLVSVALPLAMAAPAGAARVKTIRIDDASIVEGDAGQQNLAFKLTWNGSKGGAAPSVQFATADTGSATAGTDYTSASGTANLTNGGCRCATVNVPIKGDGVTEPAETFQVNLTNPSNATIGDPQAIGTIYDNEGPPALVVSDTSVTEATGSLSFSVQLTNASASTVTVDYETSDGTATAGEDYTAASGTLTYTPGETDETVAVTVADDALDENDETVLVDLTNASNAVVSDPQGIGSIVNDETEPTVGVADVNVAEGDAGSATAVVTVSLNAASGRETAVDYTTSGTTATAGVDYTDASGTLTFAAGVTSGTFDVPIAGDMVHEGNETFGVTLAGEVDLTIGDGTAVGTITDDDPVPTVAGVSRSAPESAGTVAITISLSNPSVDDVTVDWSTAEGTASAGSDYTASAGTATILAGATTTTVDVALLGDTTDEPGETFTVDLANPVDAVGGVSATVTLTDDDPTPTSLTAKAARTAKTVKAKGLLEPATAGLKVKVTLFRKRGSGYVRVASTKVSIKGLTDRDGDGKVDGRYVASFTRPVKGAYRFTVVFAGTSDLTRSTKTVTFTV